MDPETSSWQRLYPVVISFLRHELSTYDQCLREGDGDRDQMRIDISSSARKFYGWLRKDKDPRTVQPQSPEEPANFKIFNTLSRYSCDLRSTRAQLLVARRKCMSVTDRQLLNEDLREVNRRIDRVDATFKPRTNAPPEHKDFRVLVLDHEGGYFFAGRELSFSYIEPTIFSCNACAQRVWRTKVPRDLGSGIKLVVFACHCISLSVTGSYTGGVNSELWQHLVAGEKPT
jgi:hypothetical protein